MTPRSKWLDWFITEYSNWMSCNKCCINNSMNCNMKCCKCECLQIFADCSKCELLPYWAQITLPPLEIWNRYSYSVFCCHTVIYIQSDHCVAVLPISMAYLAAQWKQTPKVRYWHQLNCNTFDAPEDRTTTTSPVIILTVALLFY